MTLGFDIDGVLAWFEPAYERIIAGVLKKDLFPWGAGRPPLAGVPVWDWPQHFGYTDVEIKRVWAAIKSNESFWLGLDETPEAATLRMMIHGLKREHDVYYITNRTGVWAKWQTEMWVQLHITDENPTVLLTAQKGAAAATLGLDFYIDDNYDNVRDVQTKSHATRTYLLARQYNLHPWLEGGVPVMRVGSLGDAFDQEIAAGTL